VTADEVRRGIVLDTPLSVRYRSYTDQAILIAEGKPQQAFAAKRVERDR
jgi:hypothetical protein